MKRTFLALSALVFIVGCLGILGALLVVWVYLMVILADWNVTVGWVALVCSVIVAALSREQLEVPWKIWFTVWKWADNEIERRFK